MLPVDTLLVALLALADVPDAAAAAPVRCPAPPAARARLENLDAGARLAFIEDHIRSEAQRGRVWTYGAGGGFAVASMGAFAIGANAKTSGPRATAWVGATLLLAKAVLVFALPIEAIGDERLLRDHAQRADADADPCARLVEAEALLASAAASEERGRSPALHVLSLALDVGAGLALGAGYGRWLFGAMETAAGIGLTELAQAVRPTGSVDALADYRAGEFAPPPAEAPSPAIPSMYSETRILSVAVDF